MNGMRPFQATEPIVAEMERLARAEPVGSGVCTSCCSRVLTNVQIPNALASTVTTASRSATGLRSSVWTGSMHEARSVAHGASMTTLWPR